ncbi:secreted protein, partial [Candidatus Thiomargarita nelsonii]
MEPIMLKILIVKVIVFVVVLSAPPVVADVISNLKVDLTATQTGDNTALAINRGGAHNQVEASAGGLMID